jgi:hypothetical protein
VIGVEERAEKRSTKIKLDPDLRMFFILPLRVCIGNEGEFGGGGLCKSKEPKKLSEMIDTQEIISTRTSPFGEQG